MSTHRYIQVDIYIFINLSSFTCCIFLPILQSIPVVYGTLNCKLITMPRSQVFRSYVLYPVQGSIHEERHFSFPFQDMFHHP